jgi:hypothetical protein
VVTIPQVPNVESSEPSEFRRKRAAAFAYAGSPFAGV